MTVTLAEDRLTYDDRISRAQVVAEHHRGRAAAARHAYDRAVVDGCSIEVLDDARALKLTTALDAAVYEAAVDMLLDQAAYTVGRPRR